MSDEFSAQESALSDQFDKLFSKLEYTGNPKGTFYYSGPLRPIAKLIVEDERREIIDGLHPQPPGQWTECMRTGFQAGVNKLKELIRARPL